MLSEEQIRRWNAHDGAVNTYKELGGVALGGEMAPVWMPGPEYWAATSLARILHAEVGNLEAACSAFFISG